MIDDDWSAEYLAAVRGRTGVTNKFARMTPKSWFRTTRQNRAIHAGRVSTRLHLDAGTERNERKWRSLPDPPESTEPTIAEMQFGPWEG